MLSFIEKVPNNQQQNSLERHRYWEDLITNKTFNNLEKNWVHFEKVFSVQIIMGWLAKKLKHQMGNHQQIIILFRDDFIDCLLK